MNRSSRATAAARGRGLRGAEPGSKRGSEQGEAVALRLAALYPESHCSLHFDSPFQLLLATILSAQCTDKRVNLVTPALFRRWPTAAALADARQEELEEVIRSTGFFRAKARHILGCCRALVERHGGEVPETLPALVALPGVGRKTANVVLGVGFGVAEGVVVDTHVGRITRRLGLTRRQDAVGAERDLLRVIPRDHWIAFSHRLIDHGRAVCLARRPRCGACDLADLCPQRGLPARVAGRRGGLRGPGDSTGHGKPAVRGVQSGTGRQKSGRKPHGNVP